MLAAIGLPEILVIALILALVFGATQIPKIARALGEGLKELKKGMREAKKLDEDEPEIKKAAGKAKKPAAKKKAT